MKYRRSEQTRDQYIFRILWRKFEFVRSERASKLDNLRIVAQSCLFILRNRKLTVGSVYNMYVQQYSTVQLSALTVNAHASGHYRASEQNSHQLLHRATQRPEALASAQQAFATLHLQHKSTGNTEEERCALVRNSQLFLQVSTREFWPVALN